MKVLIGILSILLISGCNALDGQLNVIKNFNLKNSNGVTKTLELGTYTASLDQKRLSKKIVLTLTNTNEKFEFSVSRDMKIPSNGTFTLNAKDIGQDVNLFGTVNTVVTRSEMKDEWKSCMYYEPQTICTTGPNGQQSCTTQMRTRYGYHWEKFYDEFINQKITLDITPVNDEKAGEFLGEANGVNRVIVSQSDCR